MNRLKLLLALASGLAFAVPASAAPDDMSPQLRAKAQQAVDAGIKFLESKQAENGSVGNSVGLTSLMARAVAEAPRNLTDADKRAVERAAAFIASKANKDGSICEMAHDESYNTAVAINALALTKDPKYAPVIASGQKYIAGLQVGENRGFLPVDNWYGGMGYGGDERPDLSNTYVALESLRNTAYDPKDPVWQKALVFVNRVQNRSESNDQRYAGNDGGFLYSPSYNPPEYGGGTHSYGSMTAAGMLSLLFAGVDKNDPRVQAAYRWLGTNYTLDSNPGTNTKGTLFYFYNALAKVMYAYGQKEFVDARGQRHNWRNELAERLVTLQGADGSWVNKESNLWWEDKPELATAWSVIALEYALK